MGNKQSSDTPPPPSDGKAAPVTPPVQTASGSSEKDQAMSDEPLYVLYGKDQPRRGRFYEPHATSTPTSTSIPNRYEGGPECPFCVRAADVLMQTQRHHVKIGKLSPSIC